MASDRLAELLRSKSELTEGEVNRMTENEAWQWIHASESAPDKQDKQNKQDIAKDFPYACNST